MPASLPKACAQLGSRRLSPKRHPPARVAPLQRGERSTQRTLTTLRPWGLGAFPSSAGTVQAPSSAPVSRRDAARPSWHSSPNSPPPPGSSTWVPSPWQLGQIRSQRCEVGNESLSGSGLGMRRRFTALLPLLPTLSHPSLPRRTVSPSPTAQLLLGVAQDLRLQVHKWMAAPRAAAPLYFMPWSLSRRIWLPLHHLAGLRAGARTSRGTGMPSAQQQHLSCSKPRRILSSLPCRESCPGLPRSNLCRSS